MSLTQAQIRVLSWLRKFPHIRLLHRDQQYGASARWSAWWKDGASQKHMQACLGVLGVALQDEPETSRGTPQCSYATFATLYCMGLIEQAKTPVPDGRNIYGFTISNKGNKALAEIAKRG